MSLSPSIMDRIASVIRQRLHVEPPEPDADLFAHGMLDSLGLVDLLLHLEREFTITIAPDDVSIEHFRSVTQIARFVAGRRPEAAPASARGQ